MITPYNITFLKIVTHNFEKVKKKINKIPYHKEHKVHR